MKNVTRTLLTLALAASGAFAADPPADAPKKSDAELLYEAILADNTKEADKKYGEYLAALAKANEAIIKKLEAAKADYNNMKKFPKLDIAARAKAIEEIDAKILEVKKSGVGEAVVAKREADLLGEGGAKVNLKVIVGQWTFARDNDPGKITFNENMTCKWSNGMNGKWTVNKNNISLLWDNGAKFEVSLPILITGTKIVEIGGRNSQNGIMTKDN